MTAITLSQDYIIHLFGLNVSRARRISLRFFILIGICNWVYASNDVGTNTSNPSSITSVTWLGPQAGPSIIPDQRIIFVASDLRNDGVSGVVKGVAEASNTVGWHIQFMDGKGSKNRQTAALNKAISLRPDGIILGGFNANQQKHALISAQALGIPVVGWHALDTARSAPELGLFTNLTTDALEVATLAADYAIKHSGGQANVVIFTDPNYEIALAKSNTMADIIKRCPDCELLSIEELPLDQIAERMPSVINRLMKEHSTQITHFLVINDLYIDFAVPSLEASPYGNNLLPVSISAGDGSPAAFSRIKNNKYQIATVPEPLALHGWQAIDELNRALNDHPPSNFHAAAYLITSSNIVQATPSTADSSSAPLLEEQFRQAYRRIWTQK